MDISGNMLSYKQFINLQYSTADEIMDVFVTLPKQGTFLLGESAHVYLKALETLLPVGRDTSSIVSYIFKDLSIAQQIEINASLKNYDNLVQEHQTQQLNLKTLSPKIQQAFKTLQPFTMSLETNQQVYDLYLQAAKSSIIPDFKSITQMIRPTHLSEEFKLELQRVIEQHHTLDATWKQLVQAADVKLVKENLYEFSDKDLLDTPDITQDTSMSTATARADQLRRLSMFSKLNVVEISFITDYMTQELGCKKVLTELEVDTVRKTDPIQIKLLNTIPQTKQLNALNGFLQACLKQDYVALEYFCETAPKNGDFFFETAPINVLNISPLCTTCAEVLQVSVAHLTAFYSAEYIEGLTVLDEAAAVQRLFTTSISRSVFQYLSDISPAYEQSRQSYATTTHKAHSTEFDIDAKITKAFANFPWKAASSNAKSLVCLTKQYLAKSYNLTQQYQPETEHHHPIYQLVHPEFEKLPDIEDELIQGYGSNYISKPANRCSLYLPDINDEVALRTATYLQLVNDSKNAPEKVTEQLIEMFDMLSPTLQKRMCTFELDTTGVYQRSSSSPKIPDIWLHNMLYLEARFPAEAAAYIQPRLMELSSDEAIQALFTDAENADILYRSNTSERQTFVHQFLRRNKYRLADDKQYPYSSQLMSSTSEVVAFAKVIQQLDDTFVKSIIEDPELFRNICRVAQRRQTTPGKLMKEVLEVSTTNLLLSYMQNADFLESAIDSMIRTLTEPKKASTQLQL